MLISPTISVSAPKVASLEDEVASLEDEVAVGLSEMDLAKADEEVPCGGVAVKRAEPMGKVSATGSVIVAEPDLTRDKEATRLFPKGRMLLPLRAGRKIVKKRVRVCQEAIDMLLRDPPSDPIDPAPYDNLPLECKAKFFRTLAFINRLKMEEWDVICQYYANGYAEIDSYFYEDVEEELILKKDDEEAQS